MASSLLDVCRFNPAAGGTADWTYSSAVTGYQSPTAAGATNGAVYSYRAESNDLAQWEIGYGAYNSSTGVFVRTTVLFNSAGTTAKINFTTVPQVAIVALGEDLLSFNSAMSLTAAQMDQAKANLGVIGKNVIINGGFTINQRAYVSAAALSVGAYAHDRWKAGASGGDYSFSQLSSYTTVTIAANKSFIQVVEDRNIVGGAYTLSWTGTATARVTINSATPSGNFAVSPITVTGQSAGTTMSVEFTGANAAGGSSIATNAGTVGTVQLENTAKATPFEPRLYPIELQFCQRYFYVVPPVALVWPVPGATYALAFKYEFKVSMRAVPTVTTTYNSLSNCTSAAGTRTADFFAEQMSGIGAGNASFGFTATASAEL
jgi:hypothetical protein